MRVDWHYIAPGKPQQNAFVDSFNGPAARQVSKLDCIRSRGHARELIAEGRYDCNRHRPPPASRPQRLQTDPIRAKVTTDSRYDRAPVRGKVSRFQVNVLLFTMET